MICPKCKQQISKTDKFCFNCGYNLDNNRNNQWYKNSKIHVISLLILALIIASVLTIPHFINNKTTNTNHKSISTQPIENKTNSVTNDIKTQTNSVSSEAKNNGITPDEAKQELINLYNNPNIIFLNGTTFSANQIKGADELIGKYCYLFGLQGGNGIFYVVDSQNGKIYECVSKTAGVLTLEADTYKNKNNGTTANTNNVNKDNTINRNNNIQQPVNSNQNNNIQQPINSNQNNNSFTSNSSGITYTIQSIQYSPAKCSLIYINCTNNGTRCLYTLIHIEFYNSNNKVIGKCDAGYNGALEPKHSYIINAIAQNDVRNYDHVSISEQIAGDITQQYNFIKQMSPH